MDEAEYNKRIIEEDLRRMQKRVVSSSGINSRRLREYESMIRDLRDRGYDVSTHEVIASRYKSIEEGFR